MEQQEPTCPYVVGGRIKLQLEAPYDKKTAEAKITEVFESFTLSCAMVVLMDSPDLGLEGHMVLKLFDRRFATQFREDEKISPWTSNDEEQYHQFVLDGGASEFIAKVNSDSESIGDGDEWNAAQLEAYLHDLMQGFYNTEIETYNSLKDLQGKDIPQLFACLTAYGSPSQEGTVKKYVAIPGILMQHIEGFPLTNVAAHAPRETWQSLCDDAIRIVNLISDQGVLNEDVNTRSFIVHRDLEDHFKVFMTDFALCKFRREFPDETEGRQRQADQDEEGAVGYVMQRYLQGGFVYHRSLRSEELARDFKMED